MAYYYDDFKTLIASGQLPKDYLVLFQDRFLILNDQPQIYGTQINKEGKLFKLVDPKNVRTRRYHMGFNQSIDAYLERYGLNLNEEIERMMKES